MTSNFSFETTFHYILQPETLYVSFQRRRLVIKRRHAYLCMHMKMRAPVIYLPVLACVRTTPKHIDYGTPCGVALVLISLNTGGDCLQLRSRRAYMDGLLGLFSRDCLHVIFNIWCEHRFKLWSKNVNS